MTFDRSQFVHTWFFGGVPPPHPFRRLRVGKFNLNKKLKLRRVSGLVYFLFTLCSDIFTNRTSLFYVFHTSLTPFSRKQHIISSHGRMNAMCILHKNRARFSTSALFAQTFIFLPFQGQKTPFFTILCQNISVFPSLLAFQRKMCYTVRISPTLSPRQSKPKGR